MALPHHATDRASAAHTQGGADGRGDASSQAGTNIAAYERMQDHLEVEHQDHLEVEHMGQWVVVDNEQLIDAFDDFQDAADLVIEKVGPGCLLRQVGRPPAQLPALRIPLKAPTWSTS